MRPPSESYTLQTWLKSRKPYTYRKHSTAPHDYAQRRHQQWTQEWHEGRLRCEHVVWHVTNRCNLVCLHCGVRGGEKRYDDLSLEEFALHLPDLLRLGLQYITLSGGEPLVRKDLPLILELLKYSGLKTAMVTNGHYLDRFPAVVSQLDSISVSIDGLATAHNALRDHPTSYQQTLDALRYARDMEVPIRNVNTCVTPENISGLAALATDIFEAGANHWILRPVAVAGRAQAAMRPDLENIYALLCEAYALLQQGYAVTVSGLGYLANWDGVFSDTPYANSVGWNSFYILPNGDVKGFNAEELPVEGNLRNDKIPQLWQTGFRTYREAALPVACQSCPFLGRCNGGNLAEADTGYRCVRPLFDRFDRFESCPTDQT